MNSRLKTLLCLIMQLLACHACHKGQRWEHNKGAPTCKKCSPGTFMPEDNHYKPECYPCTLLTNATTEVVIKECWIEEDTVIICKPGLGLFRSENSCKECAVCEDGYELQACNSDRNTVCCGSEKSYVHNSSDGVKVCTARTLPCKQGQFFMSGNMCEPCPSGTYMAENHHNNTACYPCQHIPENQNLDGYVAMACNITPNSTSATNDHDGPCQDFASFNCSLLPGLLQNCLGKEICGGDLNKISNVTDQICSAQSTRAVDEVFQTVLIVGTGIFSILIIWLMLVWCVTGRNTLLLPLIKNLADKKNGLAKCLFIIFIPLVACYYVTLTVETENPQVIIFILLLRVVTAFCVGVVIVMGSLYVFLLQHMSERTCPECAHSLCGEADTQDVSE